MATRRMFSMHIVDSDAFLEMPVSSQLLYFHLSMRADDEGFVGSPKRIMKMIGFQDDDLKVLLAKRFVLAFESGVVVIKHWLIHNTIRMDRFHSTSYENEKKLLITKENGAYTERQPNGNQMEPQVKLSKANLSKANLNSEQSSQEKPLSDIDKLIDIFYKTVNPTINWGNKTTRKAAADLIKRFGLEGALKMAEAVVSIQGKAYAPVATTPYQMKEKLAQFKIYFDSQKEKFKKFSVDVIS